MSSPRRSRRRASHRHSPSSPPPQHVLIVESPPHHTSTRLPALLFPAAGSPYLLLAALQLADILTTALALSTHAAREANHTAAALMANYGQPAAYLTKIVGMSFVIAALWHYRHHRWSNVALYVALGLTILAVTNNTAWLLTQ